VTTARKQRIWGRHSKYGPCMYILYRNLGEYKQELSLYEAMIPWQGHLNFRTYNPGKITKYGELVRMVCEAVSGYICNMEIYSAEGKKLEHTVLLLLDRNLGQNHHIYQDNFYNSVKLAQTLLDRNVRVCGTTRQALEKRGSQHSGRMVT
jgi:hypothetical protein